MVSPIYFTKILTSYADGFSITQHLCNPYMLQREFKFFAEFYFLCIVKGGLSHLYFLKIIIIIIDVHTYSCNGLHFNVINVNSLTHGVQINQQITIKKYSSVTHNLLAMVKGEKKGRWEPAH